MTSLTSCQASTNFFSPRPTLGLARFSNPKFNRSKPKIMIPLQASIKSPLKEIGQMMF